MDSQRPNLRVVEKPGRAVTARYIGTATLELAQQARAAGLSDLGYLLEAAALTAAVDFSAAPPPKVGDKIAPQPCTGVIAFPSCRDDQLR